jgi:hypothetical protein
MSRLGTGFATLGVTLLIGSAAAAQTATTTAPAQQQPPPPFTNLKIYPKDIARPELIATMQGFVQQLGVQQQGGCAFCHAGSGPTADYAADSNPKKDVARRMILMSREITAKLPEVTAKAASDISRLRCATCHRGAPVPKVPVDTLTEVANKSGAAAAVQQYRDLRKQAIDFSESSAVSVANTLTNANKPDDALALLNVNAEMNPNHAPTFGAMAQAYMKKNDTANAIKNLEKVVQLDPNNQAAKRQLEQLKK